MFYLMPDVKPVRTAYSRASNDGASLSSSSNMDLSKRNSVNSEQFKKISVVFPNLDPRGHHHWLNMQVNSVKRHSERTKIVALIVGK